MNTSIEKSENDIMLATKKKKKVGLFIIIGIICIIAIIITVVIIASSRSGNSYNKNIKAAEKYLAELDYKSAIASYRAAIEIDPTAVEAYLGLADIYLIIGQPGEAVAVLQEGIAVTESDELKDKLDQISEYETTVESSENSVTNYTDPQAQIIELLEWFSKTYKFNKYFNLSEYGDWRPGNMIQYASELIDEFYDQFGTIDNISDCSYRVSAVCRLLNLYLITCDYEKAKEMNALAHEYSDSLALDVYIDENADSGCGVSTKYIDEYGKIYKEIIESTYDDESTCHTEIEYVYEDNLLVKEIATSIHTYSDDGYCDSKYEKMYTYDENRYLESTICHYYSYYGTAYNEDTFEYEELYTHTYTYTEDSVYILYVPTRVDNQQDSVGNVTTYSYDDYGLKK